MSGKMALPAKNGIKQSSNTLWRLTFAFAIFFATLQIRPIYNTVDEVAERGTLRVIGVAGPTTFLPHGAEGARGLQYELLRKFAENLQVTLIIEQAPNAESVVRALKSGDADIGITGLSSDDPRLAKVQISEPYLEVKQQLIERVETEANPLTEARIAVSKNSAEAIELAIDNPQADIIEVRNATPEKLLQQVNSGDVDFVVMNDAEFAAHRAAFPQLKVSSGLNTTQLAWAVRPKDKSLLGLANRFLRDVNEDGTLKRLTAFYGQGNTFNTLGVKNFQRDMQDRLPLYKSKFQQQAIKQEIDWRLLAAIGYQESKWDSTAISPTGVSGLMMLTKGTAKEMGVTNRDNPSQSIEGGAAYYKIIADKLPTTVHEPDRTWMTLAAYNMGYAHVLKARKISQAHGDDPDKWLDVSRHLRQLPRAGQALVYVQEVRRYYDALLLTTSQDSWVASADKQRWVVQ